MHTTNYAETFICVSPDTTARAGRVPDRPGSVAAMQWAMIDAAPYAHTSDDVVFAVHTERRGIPTGERPAARLAFFATGQPCLGSSPLVKTHGWGIHHDAEGRVALVGMETDAYAEFVMRKNLTILPGMRSRR